MTTDRRVVKRLFKELCAQPRLLFPEERRPLNAPYKHGVYFIRKGQKVLHVGRTARAKGGLHQRLSNHLHGSSSFTNEFLDGAGKKLRHGYTYQYLEVKDRRHRALLEAYAIGTLCPAHLGLGE